MNVLWRWRFLSSPPATATPGEAIACVVGLTDEFGASIDVKCLNKVFKKGLFVHCELISGEVRIGGQRAEVVHASGASASTRWTFRPKLPPDFAGRSESLFVRVRGVWADGGELNPFTVLPVTSAPLTLRDSATAAAIPDEIRALSCKREFNFVLANRSFNVSIKEEFAAHLGAHVWNSGIVLGNWIVEQRGRYFFDSAKVLELGSGCGLVGITAALLGADVVVSDLDAGMPHLRSNVEANTDKLVNRIRVAQLDWDRPNGEKDLGTFDVILAADVLYSPSHFGPLIQVCEAHLAPGGVVIFAYSHRNSGPVVSLSDMLAAETTRQHPFFVKSAVSGPGCRSGEDGDGGWVSSSVHFFANIELIEMRRR